MCLVRDVMCIFWSNCDDWGKPVRFPACFGSITSLKTNLCNGFRLWTILARDHNLHRAGKWSPSWARSMEEQTQKAEGKKFKK